MIIITISAAYWLPKNVFLLFICVAQISGKAPTRDYHQSKERYNNWFSEYILVIYQHQCSKNTNSLIDQAYLYGARVVAAGLCCLAGHSWPCGQADGNKCGEELMLKYGEVTRTFTCIIPCLQSTRFFEILQYIIILTDSQLYNRTSFILVFFWYFYINGTGRIRRSFILIEQDAFISLIGSMRYVLVITFTFS